MSEYRIYVRDENMRILGVVDDYIEFTATLQFCDLGTWTLKLQAGTEHARMFQPKRGIVVYRNGVDRVLFSGTIVGLQTYWTVDTDSGPGALFVTGYDDNYIAKNHVCYPDPWKSISQQDWDSDHDATRSGAKALEYLISANAGFDSKGCGDNRQPAGYDTPGLNRKDWPLDDFGPTVPYNVKFDNLMDAVKGIATAAGLGWRNVYDPAKQLVVLECWTVNDLSSLIRFSPELGNLKEFVYAMNAPKVTRAILGARGDGHNRYVKTYINQEAEDYWGIIAEQFFDATDVPILLDPATHTPKLDPDYKGDDSKEPMTLATAQAAMDQKGASHLKENGPTGNLQLYPLDTPQSVFGRDWWLGDKVTCVVEGQVHSDPVTKVTISDTADGSTLTPSLGAQGTTESANLFTEIKALWKQLNELKSRR